MSPRSSIPMGNLALPPFTRGVKWILITSVGLSILVALSGQMGSELERALAFTPEDLWLRGRIWQPFTYTLLHRSADGIIFVRDRSAEHRHDLVADVLVDRAV